MNKPLISVIMPCFNAAPFIECAINSVFTQSYPSIELIIVDDGSTDGSYKIINAASARYERLKIIKKINQGPYPARNLGISKAEGEFIAFLDADDYWSPDCIEKLYNTLIDHGADISYCGWQNVSDTGQNGPLYIPPPYEKGDIVLSFLSGCPWPIHAALVRKKLVNKINGFSTRYYSSMDYDFWLRLITLTQKIVLTPRVMAFYRWHSYGQISSTKWRQVIDTWNVKKEFFTNYPDITSHITVDKRNELVNEFLRTQAYTAFWKRELKSAQYLFRTILFSNSFRLKDMPYIILALLPYYLFSRIK